MKLSAHFQLQEFVRSEAAERLRIDNTPPQEIVPRLIAVAEMLERIRAVLGSPITVTSGYRCPELNVAIGGVRNSDHIYGRAADFVAPAHGSPTAIAKALAPLRESLAIGQLILEGVNGRKWVHVSTKAPENPVNAVLTITDAGPVPGIHELA